MRHLFWLDFLTKSHGTCAKKVNPGFFHNSQNKFIPECEPQGDSCYLLVSCQDPTASYCDWFIYWRLSMQYPYP